MNIYRTGLVLALLSTLAIAIPVGAQIPRQISYQGVLAHASGTFIPDGNHTLQLALYEHASGSVPVWIETQTVAVAHGLFNVMLGAVTPLASSLSFDRAYFLGISVDGLPELQPRTPLSAVPYALHSQSATHADRADYADRAGVANEASQLSVSATGIVRSLNGEEGNLEIIGSGATSVTTSGRRVTISSSAANITSVGATDDVIGVANPDGPTVLLSLRPGSIGEAHLSDAATSTAKLQDSSVTQSKLADASVTDAKLTGGISYSKLVGAPTSLPPGGGAGGDLVGSYPNPTVAMGAINSSKLADNSVGGQHIVDGSVGSTKIADGAITDVKVASGISYSKLVGVPTSLPPGGGAGGDLIGSYPNPTIALGSVSTEKLADGAVTDSKVASGISYDKLVGTPTSLPPGGGAGGDLSGSYPNPTVAMGAINSSKLADSSVSGRHIVDGSVGPTKIADGAITDVKVASGISYSKLVGVPTSLPPGGGAGGDLSGSYPAPIVAQIQGRPVSATAPSLDQTLKWNGTQWAPVAADNVPVGYMILGETQTPPDGYAYTGLESPVVDQWIERSSSGFTARNSFAAVAVNGRIYALGGFDGRGPVNTNEEYDPATDSWTTKSSSGFTARHGLAAAAVSGKIYALGGTTWEDDDNGITNTNEEYDPATDSWTTKSSSGFSARSSLAAAAVNGKIYALGGFNEDDLTGTTNEEYDPATDNWTTRSGLNHRFGLAAAAVNGKIYALGGFNESGPVNTNEEYDPATDSWAWTYGGFTARYDLAAVVVNGKIYALGGFNESGPLNTNEAYDPAIDRWETRSSNGFPVLFGLVAAAVNDKIYAVGTSSESGVTMNVEYTQPVVLYVHRRQ